MTRESFATRVAQERRLKAVALRTDIDQLTVAKALKVAPATVSRWENGASIPDDETMNRLAAYFGVTPAWLRYGQEPRVPFADGDTVVPRRRVGDRIEDPRPDARNDPTKERGGRKRA